MTREQAQELLNKYQLGNCTPEEQQLLDHWYLTEAAKQPVADEPSDPLADEKLIWDRIAKEIPEATQMRRFKKWYSIAAAAAILIFISFGAWFFTKSHQTASSWPNNLLFKMMFYRAATKLFLRLLMAGKLY
ncbi:hypothetical protein ACFJIV_13180 [Mucilaginibacter sp. UC70_90]